MGVPENDVIGLNIWASHPLFFLDGLLPCPQSDIKRPLKDIGQHALGTRKNCTGYRSE